MKIKKIYLFILFIMAFIFIYSCQSRFNPRYYYNKSASDIGDTGGEDLPDDFDPDDSDDDNGNSGGEKIDPFKEGEWNDPNYRFNMNFDDYVIKASFDGNNRPSYKLVKGNSQSSSPQKSEYTYNGDNTTGAGQSIQSVKYYLYKGKNPLFAADSKYNQRDKIRRFYFYRFTGKALGMVDTDNYLVAIDTYSKLVFAYAVPVKWKLYMAGTPKAPIQWGSVELGWESDYNTEKQASFKVNGASYFYEYDPIGIVKENGEIEIYQWCLDSIGNNKRYGPRIDGDLSRDIATYGKPGRSPYLQNNGGSSGNKDEITVVATCIRNSGAKSGEGWGYIGSIKTMWPPYRYDAQDWGFFTYGIGAAVYDSEIPTELVNLEELYENGVGIKILGQRGGEKFKIKNNETKWFSGANSYKLEVENIKDREVYIELASTLTKYNLLLEYIDENNLGVSGSGVKAKKDTHKVKLKYDSSKDAFVVESKVGSDLSIYNNFILKRGDRKEFRMRYSWRGAWGNSETVDILYTLGFNSLVTKK